jgi:signal transduction histidine kinase
MADETDVESPDVLRQKYNDLTRKYRELVERRNRKANQDLAIYRLGTFGLRTANAGLALVVDGRIEISNRRFTQLARSVKGRLFPLPPHQGPIASDLRELVLAHAGKMLERRISLLDSVYKDEESNVTLALRFERNVRSGQWAVTVTTENVTDRTRHDEELTRTRQALLNRERLRVLGELAASVAHDLGNTLRGASFQLSTLRQDGSNGALDGRAVKAVAKRVEIASEAIARLHEFARTGALNSTSVHLDKIVAAAAALVQVDFRSSAAPVTVHVSLPELPPVVGSASELSLLFVNLLRNARDAMPNGGLVSVAGRQTRRGVVINVADQGKGFGSDVQSRLFEAFFTTKGAEGTGLGLWLAAGTMARMGGKIEAAARRGGGAVFTLTFPVEPPIGRLPASPRRRGEGPHGPSAPGPRRLRRIHRTAKRS